MGIKDLFKKKQSAARPIPTPPKPPHFHGLTELPNLSPLDDMPSLDSFGLGDLPEIQEDEIETHAGAPLPPKPPIHYKSPIPLPVHHEVPLPLPIRHKAPMPPPVYRPLPPKPPMPPKTEFRPLPLPSPVHHEAPLPHLIRHEAPMPPPIHHHLPAPPPKPRFVPESPKLKILPPKQEHLEKPFFVKVDDYRSILEGTTLIKNNLKEADEIISRLNELKNEGDREFEKWREKLEDVQRKLIYVDKVIFEAG